MSVMGGDADKYLGLLASMIGLHGGDMTRLTALLDDDERDASRQLTHSLYGAAGMLGLPGFIWKLLALALIWAYLQHFIAGIRHLYMDVNHAVSKEFGRSSALATLVLSLGLTVVLGAKLFGLY